MQEVGVKPYPLPDLRKPTPPRTERRPEDYSAEFPLDPDEHRKEMKHGGYCNND